MAGKFTQFDIALTCICCR